MKGIIRSPLDEALVAMIVESVAGYVYISTKGCLLVVGETHSGIRLCRFENHHPS